MVPASVRKVLFWLHLAAGVAAGLVIFVMCVTGVLLTYEKAIILWADTRAFSIAPPDGGRLPIETLLRNVADAYPQTPLGTVTVSARATAPVRVSSGTRTVYVHPYSGIVLGEGAPAVRAFFRSVTEWHRYLAASGDRRTTGRAVTGAANLAFLFIVASGLVMWCPRVWTWRQVKPTLLFSGRLRGKARDFNWHNVIGFWSAIPLFVIVLGSVVISYPWASNLAYKAVGEVPPGPARPPASSDGTLAAGPTGEFEAMFARTTRQVPDWRTITFRVDGAADSPVAFTIDSGTGGQPQKKGTLTLSRIDGETLRWEPFAALTTGRQLRSWLRFVHTGEFYGLAGQTIAGLASAGGAVLVLTGLSLVVRRFAAWFTRRRERIADADISRAA